MAKLHARNGVILEIDDPKWDHSNVARAFEIYRHMGNRPDGFVRAAKFDAWCFTESGKKIQLFAKDLKTEIEERQA